MTKKAELIIVGGGPRGSSLFDAAREYCSTSKNVRLAGIVADNPDLNVPGKGKRYTSYSQFDCYPAIIKATAQSMEYPYYDSFVHREKSELKEGEYSNFEKWLYNEALGRELGDKRGLRLFFIMACFGQRWRWPIINLCNGWFFNTHPVAHGSIWDHDNPYRGTVPYETMHANEVEQCDLIAHLIDNKFDCGTEATRVGPIDLCEYNGREMYYRRGQNSTVSKARNDDLQRVRFKEQGEFVYQMHLKNACATRFLAQQLITNKDLIQCILAGKSPSAKRMRDIFPKKKAFRTLKSRPKPRFDLSSIVPV